MTCRDIKFDRKMIFLGRDGMSKSISLNITASRIVVTLQPITRDGGGRSWLQIPSENLDAVIAELNRIRALHELGNL